MKKFDILSNKHKFTSNVQKNIKMLEKKYGNTFIIKCGDLLLEVNLKKNKNKKCYSMYYDVADRTQSLYPFRIDFKDIKTNELNNNSYIANIHKTDKIKGTTMINIALQINKILNVNKTNVYDGTIVECHGINYDLSYMKLLEKNKTFYMNVGFVFSLDIHDQIQFKTSEEKYKFVIKTIEQCKKVKLVDLQNFYIKLLNLIHKILKEQDYSKMKIYRMAEIGNIFIKHADRISITAIIDEITMMLDIITVNKQNKIVYLYELMLIYFNNNNTCHMLDSILKYIVENDHYKITYKNKKISYKIFECFKILRVVRMSLFEYNFTN